MKTTVPRSVLLLTREVTVLRSACFLLAGTMRSEVFTPDHAPIAADSESRMDWCRGMLGIMAPHSKALPRIMRLLDHERYCHAWDEPRNLRKILHGAYQKTAAEVRSWR